MNVKKIINFNDIILQGLIGSGVLTLFILETSARTYSTIVLSLPIFLSVGLLLFIRYYVNNISLFFISNFLVLGLSALCFSSNLVKFVAEIYLFLIFFKSFKIRENDIKHVDETPPITTCLLFVLLGFAGTVFAKGKIYGSIYSIYFLIFLLVEFFQTNLIGINTFTDEHITIKTLPKRSIEKSNLLLMSIFCICIVLSAIFFNNPLFTNILNKLYKLFIVCIAWFLKRVLPKSEELPLETEEETSSEDIELPELIPNEENFLDTLWNFLEVVAIAAIIVAAIYFTYKIAKRLIHNFSGVNIATNGDKVEFIHDDRQKEYKIARKKKTSYKRLKNNDKIRFIYFKTLKKKSGKDYIFDSSKTPIELQNTIFSDENNALDSLELTNLYELARYNNTELSASDVNMAKELSNSILSHK